MKKTTKTNTAAKKTPKSDRPVVKTVEEEYYKNMFSFTTKITDEYLNKLALEWVELAMKDTEMLCLEEFHIAKGIYWTTLSRWMKRCVELQQAHDHVMSILGCRREKGALTKKYDSSVVLKSMAMYNIKWKEIEEWRATMSAKVAAAGGGIQVVEIERFADSPLVPHKKV